MVDGYDGCAGDFDFPPQKVGFKGHGHDKWNFRHDWFVQNQMF